MIRSALLSTAVLIVTSVQAEVKRLVIGNSENPWRDWGSFENIDDASRPGWIQPRKTSRDVDILNKLYQEGRLWGGEKPAYYKPGDGRIWSPNAPYQQNKENLPKLADGAKDTLVFDYFNRRASNKGVTIYIDLGAPYPVEEIKFYPLHGDLDPTGEHSDLYMKGYEVYANDGSPETQDEYGRPIYHLIAAEPTNTDVVVTIDVFPPQYIRYIKLRCTSPLPFELDQIEVRGQGYLRRAVFTSKIIDLGDAANFGRILWSGIEEPGSHLKVYTRNGSDKTVLKYYMINDIGELEELKGETDEENRKKWLSLPEDAKGPVVDDTENWTPWSVPYDSSGQVIFSKGPRRYLQFMVVMESDVTTNRSLMDSLVIEYSQPVLARRLLGKIFPRKGVPLGDSVEFKYKVIPEIDKDKGDVGFDVLRIRTPTKAGVTEVRLGGVPLPKDDYRVEAREDLLEVHLLGRKVDSDDDSLEVSFKCVPLIFGTVFEGMAFASWAELLGQRIEVEEVEDLSVQASVNFLGRVLGHVRAHPEVFTPNGDGINDSTTISFVIFQMIGEAPLKVDVYDLSGHLIRHVLPERPVKVGFYEVSWDGKDEDGELVPPGAYLYRVVLKGDKRHYTGWGTVTVAY